jgi:hypothetical protein
MKWVTEYLNPTFDWIETRLDKGAWFRRGYVIAATILTWQVTLWAMRFAESSTRPGSDVALIIGAVVAAPGAVATFAFGQYLNSRAP